MTSSARRGYGDERHAGAILRYDDRMSLANKITLGRALLIAPTVVCLLLGYRLAAFFLFGIACLGDILDGIAARARDEITTWGKVLDPAADKALYVALFCSLYVLGELPVLAFVLFLIPQVALGIGALWLRVGKQAVQSARIVGKAASVLSFVALEFLIMRWPGDLILLYVAIGLTYIASVDYLRGAIRIPSKAS